MWSSWMCMLIISKSFHRFHMPDQRTMNQKATIWGMTGSRFSGSIYTRLPDYSCENLETTYSCMTLTLCMLGNFLKIDNSIVCFLKPVNSTCFLWGMIDWVANRLDLRPAAAGLDPTCLHKHKCGSRTERVKLIIPESRRSHCYQK